MVAQSSQVRVEASQCNTPFAHTHRAGSKLSFAYLSPWMASSNWRFWSIKNAVIFCKVHQIRSTTSE